MNDHPILDRCSEGGPVKGLGSKDHVAIEISSELSSDALSAEGLSSELVSEFCRGHSGRSLNKLNCKGTP